jgi:hypothetical protein
MTSAAIPPRIHVLAKPTGATCNLQCSHCFFLNKDRLYPGSHFRMRDEVLETYIRQLIEYHRSPRVSFFYFSDDGDLTGLRYDNWKFAFMEQRMQGTCAIWAEPFVALRIPKIFNLRTDPFERADITSNTYWDWVIDHAFLLIPAQKYVGDFLATFKEFPPRQKAASFSIDQILEKLQAGLGSH